MSKRLIVGEYASPARSRIWNVMTTTNAPMILLRIIFARISQSPHAAAIISAKLEKKAALLTAKKLRSRYHPRLRMKQKSLQGQIHQKRFSSAMQLKFLI